MSSSLLQIEDDDDGWDLNAVVRSCRPANSSAKAPPPPPPPREGLLLPSHNTSNSVSNSVHELENLCKPFISTTQQPKFNISPCSSSPATATPRPQLARSKRRKNQQKRMVCQVLADGLSGDMWAWRKYGQKPIKGSPFPRSSKGCVARKQVERSRTDSGKFMITYTGEHNHPPPTHRNSLAGSTRQKFPAAGAEGGGGNAPEPSTSAREGGVRLSPNTPLTAGMEVEEEEEEEVVVEEDEEELDMLLVEDMELVGEDGVLFMGFEELQSTSSPVEDEVFGWKGEPRQAGTPPWPPAVAD